MQRVKENTDLVKTEEGIILNVNSNAKASAKSAKRMRLKQMQDNENNCRKIERLENEISEIKALLVELKSNTEQVKKNSK